MRELSDLDMLEGMMDVSSVGLFLEGLLDFWWVEDYMD